MAKLRKSHFMGLLSTSQIPSHVDERRLIKKILLEVVKDKNVRKRKKSLEVLAEILDDVWVGERLLNYLCNLFISNDTENRELLSKNIKEVSLETSNIFSEALLKCLERDAKSDSDIGKVSNASLLLGFIDKEKYVPKIIEIFEVSTKKVGYPFLHSTLAAIGDHRATKPLLHYVFHSHYQIDAACAHTPDQIQRNIEGVISSLEKLGERFINNKNETILDLKTGLTWTGKPVNRQIIRKEAAMLVHSLDMGGYKHWRLPTKEELINLFTSFKDKDDSNYSKKAKWFEEKGFSELITWDSFYHSSSSGSLNDWYYHVGVEGTAIEDPNEFIGCLLPVTEEGAEWLNSKYMAPKKREIGR